MKTRDPIKTLANPNHTPLTLSRWRAALILPALLLLMLSATVQAQFNYSTSNGEIIITGYTGPGGAVTIPDRINGFPVTSIGDFAFEARTLLTNVTVGNGVMNIRDHAFSGCTRLREITIPSSVTSLGWFAFYGCTSLREITIPEGVTLIESGAFADCTGLTSIRIPDSVTTIRSFDDANSLLWGTFQGCTNLANATIGNGVTSIEEMTFQGCTSLTSVSVGKGVMNIRDYAFSGCTRLGSLYFQGNAPSSSMGALVGADHVTVYYLPGTAGWQSEFAGRPTVVWPSPLIVDGTVAVRGGAFGFTIHWAPNVPVVVEASWTVSHPTWSPVSTIAPTGGVAEFSDPEWAKYPARFYRLRSP